MRIIAIILSFIIFNMVILPCSDGNTCDDDVNIELSDIHDHSQDEDDDCTPLCLCSCCGVLDTFTNLNLHLQKTNFSGNPCLSFYSDPRTLGIINAVWRPPSNC